MSALRQSLPPLPSRMNGLPIDNRGFPVPWFVEWIGGEPKFQVADSTKFIRAIKYKYCWICGNKLGQYGAFVVGPMCGINRISADPPSHRECAEFAVKGCPFMAQPMAVRSTRGIENLPVKNPAGIMLTRNPGVSLMWVTKRWYPVKAPGGYLIQMGHPEEIRFYREGRPATKDEIEASVSTGLPALQKMAEDDGQDAISALAMAKSRFDDLLAGAFQ